MHCVSILYRKTPDSWFDMDYYVNSHLPLAYALLQQHFGVIPVRAEIFGEGIRMGTDEAAYHCMFNMYFHTREDASRLLDLRTIQEQLTPAERTVDIRKFSSLEPEAFLWEVNSVDSAQTLARGSAIRLQPLPD